MEAYITIQFTDTKVQNRLDFAAIDPALGQFLTTCVGLTYIYVMLHATLRSLCRF